MQSLLFNDLCLVSILQLNVYTLKFIDKYYLRKYKMKRASAILLIVFYLIPALGFSITTHFCAGELADVSFYSDDSKCVCGAEKMNTGCCSSTTTFVKIKDSQTKSASTNINFVKSLTKLFYTYPSSIIKTSSVSRTDFSSFGSPPDISVDDPIYILNRVFRI